MEKLTSGEWRFTYKPFVMAVQNHPLGFPAIQAKTMFIAEGYGHRVVVLGDTPDAAWDEAWRIIKRLA